MTAKEFYDTYVANNTYWVKDNEVLLYESDHNDIDIGYAARYATDTIYVSCYCILEEHNYSDNALYICPTLETLAKHKMLMFSRNEYAYDINIMYKYVDLYRLWTSMKDILSLDEFLTKANAI